jgi:hypothetical protein
VPWLLNADANGGLGIRMQKVEVERLKAGVRQMRTMDEPTLRTRTHARLPLNASSKRCAPLLFSPRQIVRHHLGRLRQPKNVADAGPSTERARWVVHPFVCFYRSKSIKRAHQCTRRRILSTFSIPPHAPLKSPLCARAASPAQRQPGSNHKILQFWQKCTKQ